MSRKFVHLPAKKENISPLLFNIMLFRQKDGSESVALPRDFALLISDALDAPATFLIVQHLAIALKAKRPCVLVGLTQSLDYYTALLRKQVQTP